MVFASAYFAIKIISTQSWRGLSVAKSVRTIQRQHDIARNNQSKEYFINLLCNLCSLIVISGGQNAQETIKNNVY